MDSRLLMLINMKSGTKSSKNNLLDAIDVFCKHGYTVTTYITQKANDAYEYLLNNQIEYDIHDNNPDILLHWQLHQIDV